LIHFETERARPFASDNYAPALTEALEAIATANTEHVVSHSADPVMARVAEHVREHFGAGAVRFPAFNGTAF
jgi:threonine aldolase